MNTEPQFSIHCHSARLIDPKALTMSVTYLLLKLSPQFNFAAVSI